MVFIQDKCKSDSDVSLGCKKLSHVELSSLLCQDCSATEVNEEAAVFNAGHLKHSPNRLQCLKTNSGTVLFYQAYCSGKGDDTNSLSLKQL